MSNFKLDYQDNAIIAEARIYERIWKQEDNERVIILIKIQLLGSRESDGGKLANLVS